jgi:diacylglycerol kinase (ATP)
MNGMTQPKTPADKLSSEVSALKSKGVLKRVFKATTYSIQGFKAAWLHEAAFRSEAVLALLALLLAFATPFTAMQRLILLGCWVLVIIVELLNSAIEAIVDLASPAIHPLAGRAKDIASAAVMTSLLFTLTVWGLIAVPVWWNLLR